jgi:hypothetical protein
MTRSVNVVLATAGEGALILAAGAISLALRMPLIFTSLGPTAYEMVERPTSRSAKTYNIIVGHHAWFGGWILFSMGFERM